MAGLEDQQVWCNYINGLEKSAKLNFVWPSAVATAAVLAPQTSALLLCRLTAEALHDVRIARLCWKSPMGLRAQAPSSFSGRFRRYWRGTDGLDWGRPKIQF